MKNKFDEAIHILHEKKASCVILYKDKEPYLSEEIGIKPLMVCLRKDKNAFKDSVIADKVIGKAAALMAMLGKAAAIYGEVMSQSAEEFLKKQNILYKYGTLVPYIENRTKTGKCPMELAVAEVDDPVKAFEELEKTIKKLMQEKQNKN